MPTVITATHAQVATARGKVGVAHPAAKKTNCGSGKGGFKPGNTCGKEKREALAADLRAARAAARSDGERKTLNQSAKALKDHRRGHAEAIDDDRARTLRAGLKGARASAGLAPRTSNTASKPVDPASHTDHAPGHVGYLKTGLIRTDAHRFQYKLGASESGSVGSLAGVRKYDHELGGVLSVWKDPANGHVFVINGHNRLDLAKKLGADRVTVRFIDAKDATEARAKGALQNIAEGRGTTLDAAKFFRDTGFTKEQVADKGIPLREKIATDGLALSRLEDGAFKRVVNGDLTPERGAIIGGAGLEHHEQRALMKLVDKHAGRRATEVSNATLRELTDTVKSSRSVRKESRDLFGSSAEDESLALHKAKLQATIKDRLSKEKRLFGIVAKSKHAEDLARAGNAINTHESAKVSADAATTLGAFDRLKNLSGPVSRSLERFLVDYACVRRFSWLISRGDRR